MEQWEENIIRFRKPAMALVGGVGAALVVATLPHVYLENIIGATGISEIVPAAAPPLGNTARSLIAVAAGVFAASVVFVFLNRKGGSDMGLAIRENLTPEVEEEPKPRFSMPKISTKSLTKFLRKPKKKKGQVKDLADLPKLREADSHPDAPARRPIFAESDLGSPLPEQIKPFEDEAAQQPAVQEAVQNPVAAEPVVPAEPTPAAFSTERSLEMPPMPSFEPEPANEVEAASVASPMEPQVSVEPQVAVAAAAPKEDLSGLSIAQLADRLEAGLSRLKELDAIADAEAATEVASVAAPQQVVAPEQAAAPVQSPPPLKPVEPSAEDVQAARQADMDAALKAALGTLEKMTAQR